MYLNSLYFNRNSWPKLRCFNYGQSLKLGLCRDRDLLIISNTKDSRFFICKPLVCESSYLIYWTEKIHFVRQVQKMKSFKIPGRRDTVKFHSYKHMVWQWRVDNLLGTRDKNDRTSICCRDYCSFLSDITFSCISIFVARCTYECDNEFTF